MAEDSLFLRFLNRTPHIFLHFLCINTPLYIPSSSTQSPRGIKYRNKEAPTALFCFFSFLNFIFFLLFFSGFGKNPTKKI